MILVTLGTQDKDFHRLLVEIDRLIAKKVIKDKVIAQAGYTKFSSNNMEVFDLIPREKFNQLLSTADVIITHGGVGSIITALKYDKKVIAVPRLAKYKEHINDHQKQIVTKFSALGYIIGVEDVTELERAYKKLPKFKPKKFTHDNSKMLSLVSELIEK